MSVVGLVWWLVLSALLAVLSASSARSELSPETTQVVSEPGTHQGADQQQHTQRECRSFCNPDFWASAWAFDVEVRLDAGAEPNARSDEGASPLHYAALTASDAGAVQTLIDAGAEIEAREPSQGFTPLFYAAWLNNRVAMRVLLENGADVTATAENGLTALHLAVQFAEELPPSLIASDSSAKQAEQLRRLESDWRERFPSTVHSLLEYGADPNAVTDAGETACILANDWVSQSEVFSEICPKS